MESTLQSECNKLLKLYGVKFFHPEKGRGKNLTHRSGWPDLTICFQGGEVCFVELKTKIGVLSSEQREFQAWAVDSGYKYIIIRDKNDFHEWLLDNVRHVIHPCPHCGAGMKTELMR
jgi:hypothetical protein